MLIQFTRQCNTDWALACVLRLYTLHRFICYSYDINCQNEIHRVRRFLKWFPELAPLVQSMVNVIPKMHIHNHIDDCTYRYSLNYTPCMGNTCGEGIETTWAEGNQTAGSTKKENRGHRQDTLDDFHGYWNWGKVIKMGALCKDIPCLFTYII